MAIAEDNHTGLRLPPARLLRWEIFAVLAVSLGASALNALLDLIGSLLSRQALGKQEALLVGSLAANHWLDLALQLASIAESLAPVLLVLYLMARSGERPGDIGLDTSQPGRDVLRGAILAAVIGGAGLGLYIAAYQLGFSLNVVPESLPAVWWRIPVLLLSAAHDGILEEIVVLAYLLRRLDQLSWTPWKAIVLSAVLRGSYHLYQGFGAFLGNAAMGLVFGVLYKRWGRCTPMIIAHTLIDAVAFVGYAALHGKVSWLP
ncbi:MAG TPA: CPBP family intramembrane glutamic endopeptidase [Streptosporangiaceae bacterium]|nr:CPBP family intramembrane glutamic endopeptidase [Streptosporangiaceae bacterium]